VDRAIFLTVREVRDKQEKTTTVNSAVLNSNEEHQYRVMFNLIYTQIGRYRNNYRCVYVCKWVSILKHVANFVPFQSLKAMVPQ
jgi:glycopeptide antibiotics resistance protein